MLHIDIPKSIYQVFSKTQKKKKIISNNYEVDESEGFSEVMNIDLISNNVIDYLTKYDIMKLCKSMLFSRKYINGVKRIKEKSNYFFTFDYEETRLFLNPRRLKIALDIPSTFPLIIPRSVKHLEIEQSSSTFFNLEKGIELGERFFEKVSELNLYSLKMNQFYDHLFMNINISTFDKLSELNLSGSMFYINWNIYCRFFKFLRNLNSFIIDDCLITSRETEKDENIHFPSVKYLSAKRCSNVELVLYMFANVEKIDLTGVTFKDDEQFLHTNEPWYRFNNLRMLHTLILDSTNVKSFKYFENIKNLSIQGCYRLHDGKQFLYLQNIEKLNLFNSFVADLGNINHICLKYINIGDHILSDEELSRILSLKSLSHVSIFLSSDNSNKFMVDADVSHIKFLSMETDYRRSKITTVILKKLNCLEELVLNKFHFMEAYETDFENMHNLKKLHVTDYDRIMKENFFEKFFNLEELTLIKGYNYHDLSRLKKLKVFNYDNDFYVDRSWNNKTIQANLIEDAIYFLDVYIQNIFSF